MFILKFFYCFCAFYVVQLLCNYIFTIKSLYATALVFHMPNAAKSAHAASETVTTANLFTFLPFTTSDEKNKAA